jgi:hypothetical protein|tara:strand:- start:1728 stop:2639 length:912 start_codon:yes stop_codon:yes gene_type:complete
MAFAVSSYSETPFGADPSNVIAYPQGSQLTSSLGANSTEGDNNVDVTGIQLTSTNGGAVGGSSVLVSVTGSQLSTSIGEEDINVGVPLTGIELSITDKTTTQDTLTAFGETPFTTLSPSTFNIPSVFIEATTGAPMPSFLLQSTLGTYSVSADGNASIVVTEHTMNTSIGSVTVTGIANVSVTGTQMSMSLGDESAFTDHTVAVTGQQLTMSMGEETPAANADVTVTGIQLTSSIGTATQSTGYDVSGIQMSSSIGSVTMTGDANIDVTGVQLQTNTGNPNITAWAEIDPGVSNVWTEVDLAA